MAETTAGRVMREGAFAEGGKEGEGGRMCLPGLKKWEQEEQEEQDEQLAGCVSAGGAAATANSGNLTEVEVQAAAELMRDW